MNSLPKSVAEARVLKTLLYFTGKPCKAGHVDHVYPLQGKVVSGLHVPYTVQVIPGVENVRKANRMPA